MNVDTEEENLRGNSYILVDDTVIDNEKANNKTNKTITTEIVECHENDEILDYETFLVTVTMEITTNDTVEDKITDHQVES